MSAPSDQTPVEDTVPSAPELPLPTAADLTKATGIALAIAAVLLVFVVLPAEYNIDATGFGRAIGLTRLSDPEAKTDSKSAGAEPSRDGRKDSVEIEVLPGKSLEYKFSLRAGEKLKYSWKVKPSRQSDRAPSLFFDFHGEPKGGKKGFFESYAVSTAKKARGTLTAPFDGAHGWYWKNKTDVAAKVTLVTSGSYEVLGLR
jgi:hypothetical protein